MTPITIAHRNSATRGLPAGGMSGTASEKVPKPVQLSSPMKISEPTPAASSPGASTTPSIGPPIPATSIIRNAAGRGEPRSVLIAAKLPAAPITTLAISGASRLTRWTARTPRPLPIAIRGASGPRTTPRLSVANEAMTIPGSSIGGTGPDDLNPSAGLCPAVPGRCRIVSATSRPLSASSGIGHQTGWLSKPRSPGRVPIQIVLQSGETLEKEVRGRRHRHTDDRAEHEQHDVRAAPEKLGGTRCSPCRRRRVRLRLTLFFHAVLASDSDQGLVETATGSRRSRSVPPPPERSRRRRFAGRFVSPFWVWVVFRASPRRGDVPEGQPS